MPRHPIKPGKTLLESWITEEAGEASDEERRKWREDARRRWLDRFAVTMVLDKEFAREFCEMVANEDHLFDAIVKARKQKRLKGRKPVLTNSALTVMLMEYASSLASGCDRVEARRQINIRGRKLSDESIENALTKGIGKVRAGIIDLPDWAKLALRERISRGSKVSAQSKTRKSAKSSKLR